MCNFARSMYPGILFIHSVLRWFVVLSLLLGIYRGLRGWMGNKIFLKKDNSIRHITATIMHMQLVVGYLLYFESPLVSYFRKADSVPFEARFFGWIHVLLMTLAVVVVTIGSSLAKRQVTDKAKFKTMTIFFILALVIIFISIPWPFSPFAARPYFRSL